MAGRDQYKASDFIQAIPGTGGIITAISKKVGCDWNTTKKYITEYATVQQAYQAEVEGVTDLAEVKLIEAVKGGDLSAVKFYLTTKGKGRGYSERREIVGANNGPIKITLTWGDDVDSI